MIGSVQILRFLAALLVVLSHVGDRLQGFEARFGSAVFALTFSGDFGVRIFFVISGFLMIWISLDKFGKPQAARHFLFDRVTRIVPLYWMLTCAQLVFLVWASSRGDASAMQSLSTEGAIKSFFFIPFLNNELKHRPLLAQGWTLDYEMFFYAIFAACLLFRRAVGLTIVFASLGVLVLLGRVIDFQSVVLQVWTDQYLVAFIIGMALGLARARLKHISASLPAIQGKSLVLIVVVLTGNFLFQGTELEPIINTACAAAAVALCVLTREQLAGAAGSRFFEALGTSSYSLYLVHGFWLLVVGIAWRKLFGGEHLFPYWLLTVGGSIVLGHLCWKYVERPLTRLVRGGNVPAISRRGLNVR